MIRSVREVFELRAGPDVKYVSDRKPFVRQLEIRYIIPELEEGRVFTATANLSNGLSTTLYRAVCRLAIEAQQNAYNRTGKRDRDMAMMLQGKVMR